MIVKNQIWINEYQVWEQEDWEESNLDEWKNKFDKSKDSEG